MAAIAILANIACKKEKTPSPTAGKVADFTFCGATCADSAITFCADASLDGKSVIWDFGDGTTSQEYKPVHIYKDTGNYDVTLAIAGQTISVAKKTITLTTCAPFIKKICRTWLCDQEYFTTGNWYTPDTTIFSSNVRLEVLYESPLSVKIGDHVLYYAKYKSTQSEIVFTVPGTIYYFRTLYYYPANDSVKYHALNRTNYNAHNTTTLYSRK